MSLSLDKCAILSLVLEAALWGFSLMMFGVTIYLLYRSSPSSDVGYWNITRSSLLMLGSTVHLAASGVRVVNGLIIHANDPGGSVSYLALAHKETIWMCVFYCYQTILGDAIVIHRCYVVWQSLWVVSLPLSLWFGNIGSLFAMCHRVILISDGKHALSADFPMMLSFSFTLAANITATGLLAFRLYKVHRDLARSRATVTGSLILPVLRTTLDAGALYTALLIAAIVIQVTAADPSVLPNIIIPSISIIFYMIMIRTAIAKSQPRASVLLGTRKSTSASASTLRFESNRMSPTIDIYVSSSMMTDSSTEEKKSIV